MDNIWYRNPSKSEVIGRCGGDEKTNDHTEPTKVERYKKQKKQKKLYLDWTSRKIIEELGWVGIIKHGEHGERVTDPTQ